MSKGIQNKTDPLNPDKKNGSFSNPKNRGELRKS